ncbi:MAG: helix-turn-helix transcriptional regulator [Chitinophagaceae bacterium]|nr:helix-turn-helix transcriptional regulator [Chitinophagaceae bacterium]
MNNGTYLKQMGSKIKAARKAQKMTLQRLSDLSGATDLSNLWFIENGMRNVHILTLKSIADVLKLDVKDLL